MLQFSRVLTVFSLCLFLASCDKKKEPARHHPAPAPAPTESKKDAPAWTSLFDGKTLGKWKSANFGGEGEVRIEDGAIVMPAGVALTGVTYTGDDCPKINYEIELEARRVDGADFFCGLTFPVNDTHASLILGGWAGTICGISSLDGEDASANETSQAIRFEMGRWYHVRMRVLENKLQAWLDEEQIIDVNTTGKKIDIRVEVAESRPLGIATWQTTGAVKNIRLRKIESNP